ncbi:hypothetical protein AUCHE_20_00300 [Austwickia chelonae NBRC 105200]|uniref:DUF11 domain-containing protein n=1 Tax=Austwickia chelonae NBRC 105200 TaxID=1184607 RepID=K6VQY9_9MICO|nr:hypothetical protein AUCHE_20_00300 [Austwickia chelonae NBRC 105200]
MSWSAPKEIHEFTTWGTYQMVDVRNDGAVRLVPVAASLDGQKLDVEYSGCSPVEAGESCRFLFPHSMDGVPYPKNWDSTLSVTMKSPDGALHVRKDTHRVSVVNDPPEQLFIMQAISDAVDPDQGVGYCRIPNYFRRIPEISNLVSLSSEVLGDLMDKKNAKIVSRGTMPWSCEDSWVSSVKVAPGDSLKDVVTATVADDDGLTVSTAFAVTWRSTKPAPKLKATLAVDQKDLAETGEQAKLTLTATNVSTSPVTVSRVSTPEGAVPLSSCQGGPVVSPGKSLVCRYTTKEALKGKPRSSVAFEASVATTDGEVVAAKASTTFRDVYPLAEVTLQVEHQGDRSALVTMVARGVSPEPGRVHASGLETAARVTGGRCEDIPPVLTMGAEWRCSFTYQLNLSHPQAVNSFDAWVTLVDDDRTFGTSAAHAQVLSGGPLAKKALVDNGRERHS